MVKTFVKKNPAEAGFNLTFEVIVIIYLMINVTLLTT
jgi:hypothetical protein